MIKHQYEYTLEFFQPSHSLARNYNENELKYEKRINSNQ